MDTRRIALTCLAALALFAGCAPEPDPADLARAVNAQVDVYFNASSSRQATGSDALTDDVLVQTIDHAQVSIDAALYGLSRRTIIEALIRAHERGVAIRFVGDARTQAGYVGGYLDLDRLNIPTQVGNNNNIMHNKFLIVDRHRVYVGTGNITSNSFDGDNNNWVIIDSPAVAADFQAEFEQMFDGRFGAAKRPIVNGEVYEVGDTTVEVYFSPQEDSVGRLLRAIEEAQESIRFFIFAFTKDQVGAALIRKHEEFSLYNRCCDPVMEAFPQACAAVTCETPFRPRFVRGVIDQSQLHSNGPYHEAYRLLAFGVDVVMDGNDNSRHPGDYQGGGARQHDKTMVIDAGLPSGIVLTGSFNWSASATQANDEVLLGLRGLRLPEHYGRHFDALYRQGRRIGNRFIGDGLNAGDVVFNEIHWDGYNGDIDTSDFAGDLVYNDEFIELLNTTPDPIDLSMWTIATDDDFVVGLYPGTIIGPYERFLIVDHNIEPFQDAVPQRIPSAFSGGDLVMNVANDPRFLRLNLHNADFRIRLVDPAGQVMDVAGDGGPPFVGGRQQTDGGLRTYSMERIHVVCPEGDAECSPFGPGDQAASWQACQRDSGGSNVTERYRDIVIATPGEPNSGGEQVPDEVPGFRAPVAAEATP
jgi:phosphatidylserine/phosphatidylglycerophosphate/cardiolipin synthase-like enzyme